MADIFQEEEEAMTVGEYEEIVEEAFAVLGADDPDKCTYDMGYRKRQALYSCLTCVPPPKIQTPSKGTEEGGAGSGGSSRADLRDILSGDWKPAGICTSCSLKCHDGHELVELYTKRRFRCDCGTSKFHGSAVPSCQLKPDKDPLNERNEYNQNYAGVYCNCRRPYPDPEAEAQDGETDMIQCVVCEDWFHEHHLGLEPVFEAPEEFSNLICDRCATVKCRFLKLYPQLLLAPERTGDVSSCGNENKIEAVSKEEADANGDEASLKVPGIKACDDVVAARGHHAEDVDAVKPQQSCSSHEGPLDKPADDSTSSSKAEHLPMGPNESEGSVPTGPKESDGSVKATSAVSDADALGGSDNSKVGPLFLTNGWRASICNCQECTRFYEDQGVDFLVDVEDTVEFYEEEAKKKRQQKEEEASVQVEAQFQSMDRVAQLEIIHGLNSFKSDFQEFLAKFAGTDHVITAQDVKQFSEEQKAKRLRHS
ncbi:unnamed protein product [Closterium sp. Yama58-4]|nr:unnamed protein product [Closterium sp. Yama58-4]